MAPTLDAEGWMERGRAGGGGGKRLARGKAGGTVKAPPGRPTDTPRRHSTSTLDQPTNQPPRHTTTTTTTTTIIPLSVYHPSPVLPPPTTTYGVVAPRCPPDAVDARSASMKMTSRQKAPRLIINATLRAVTSARACVCVRVYDVSRTGISTRGGKRERERERGAIPLARKSIAISDTRG